MFTLVLRRKLEGMKKWAVAIGIILLLLSLVLLASYRVSYITIKSQTGPANPSGTSNLSVWECPGNFSANDTILVDILPNIFWSGNVSAFELLDNGMPVMYIDVSIIDPENGTSKYETEWTYDPNAVTKRLTIFNASVVSAGEGIDRTVHLASDFVNSVTFIAGTAKIEGTYYANLTSAGATIDYRSDGSLKPGAFALYYARAVMKEAQPYTSVLYVCFVTIPAGVVLLVYGLITGRKRNRRT